MQAEKLSVGAAQKQGWMVGQVTAAVAEVKKFGKPLVVSPFTIALMTGMSVSDTSGKAIANLGWDEVRMTKPLFVGDTLYAESEVLEKRESKSREGQGIVTFKTTAKNQHGDIVSHYKRSVLVWKRGHGNLDD